MQQYSKLNSNFPNQFQRESLQLINKIIDLTSSAFYLIDADMKHLGVALYNLAPDIDKEYQQKFRHLDPLNPRKFSRTDKTVVTIDSQVSSTLLKQSTYYQEFMKPYDHRYVADMFFRFEGEIIAVLSMLRHESMGAFDDKELTLLRNIQPFLEYTLNCVYLPRRISERQSIQDRYMLTNRELDVLELVVAGASNKVIANELALGLPTVKTHLWHIFQKTESTSRTELLSKIFKSIQS